MFDYDKLAEGNDAALALKDLIDDVRLCGAPSFQWCMRHVGHAGLRTTVQRLWGACGIFYRLFDLVRACDGDEAYLHLRDKIDGRTGLVLRTNEEWLEEIRADMPVAPLLPCERRDRD